MNIKMLILKIYFCLKYECKNFWFMFFLIGYEKYIDKK